MEKFRDSTRCEDVREMQQVFSVKGGTFREDMVNSYETIQPEVAANESPLQLQKMERRITETAANTLSGNTEQLLSDSR